MSFPETIFHMRCHNSSLVAFSTSCVTSLGSLRLVSLDPPHMPFPFADFSLRLYAEPRSPPTKSLNPGAVLETPTQLPEALPSAPSLPLLQKASLDICFLATKTLPARP